MKYFFLPHCQLKRENKTLFSSVLCVTAPTFVPDLKTHLTNFLIKPQRNQCSRQRTGSQAWSWTAFPEYWIVFVLLIQSWVPVLVFKMRGWVLSCCVSLTWVPVPRKTPQAETRVGMQPGGLLSTLKIDRQRKRSRPLASDVCGAGVDQDVSLTNDPQQKERKQHSRTMFLNNVKTNKHP